MTKLIVQIPCYNEEKTLPLVLSAIPKRIDRIDEIETMIMDDGSTDHTVELAKLLGVDHIVTHKRNVGLARNFEDGLNESLKQGADIIVNLDGDNQHPAEEIPKLIQPILNGTHDMVVADREVQNIEYFSLSKKFLQKLGSWVVKKASDTDIADAVSGFRAFSRIGAMALNIVNDFSYTTETIIQAGRKKLAITHIPINERRAERKSRLFKSLGSFVSRSAAGIIRSYTMYKPFKVFLVSGLIVFLIGTIPYFRILFLILTSEQTVGGHIQSLILGAVFIILGFMIAVIGIVADLMAVNRKLTEDILFRLKKQEYESDNSNE